MTRDAVAACRATVTEDSIEPNNLVAEIIQAAFAGDKEFLQEIAIFAASYVDQIISDSGKP